MNGNAEEVAAVNDNYERAFVLFTETSPTGVVREFGGLTAISSGIPVSSFNQAFVFDPPASEDLAAAVSWLVERGDPFTVTVPAPLADSVEAHAADLGIAHDGSQPGMAMPLENLPDHDSALDIAAVTDPADLDPFAEVSAAAFEMPLDLSRDLASEAVLSLPEVTFLLGSVEGEVVACGTLTRTGDIAGVYNIGVPEPHRRRGFGTAMTWEVLHRGREAGCGVGTLLSSAMGLPVYERMGFETVIEYQQFHPIDHVDTTGT